jgi:hypothetical protein
VFGLSCDALLEYMDHEDIEYDIDARLFELVAAPRDLLVEPLMLDLRTGVEPAPLVRFCGYDETDDDRPMTAPEHSSFMAMLFAFAFMKKCLPRFACGYTLRSESHRSAVRQSRAASIPGLAAPARVIHRPNTHVQPTSSK